MLILVLVIIPVLAFVLKKVLHKLLTPHYPVHDHGIVLVTGTSSGIGNAAVMDLARDTNFTVFAGVRRKEDAEKLKKEAGERKIVPILLDVTSKSSIMKAVENIKVYMKDHNLPFVGLINNAGIGHGIVFETYPLEEARRVFDVNVFGLMEVTQFFLPLLRESKGRIINIGSFAGTHAMPMGSVYCATKHAVEALSDSLRRELRDCKVAVSLMEPGFVKSVLVDTSHIQSKEILLKHKVPIEEMSKVYPKHFNEKLQDKKRDMLQGRPSEPSEVTAAIHHAMTSSQPEARYVLANVGGVPAWIVRSLFHVLPDSMVDFIYVVT
ncbi:SDR family NAD(P)-dependent oxidoreductase [archaeon]|nr:MAG: SDR family NAD(P)-dependent oxidoreductase [archaeon]